MPSIPGIMISDTIRSGANFSTFSNTSWALSKVTTSNPSFTSRSLMRVR